MKRSVKAWLPTCLVLFLLAGFGCRDQPPETVDLVLNISTPVSTMRSMDSVSTAYEPSAGVSSYRLICNGPRDSSFTLNSSSESTVLKGIYAGEWTFIAEGVNDEDTVIIAQERTVFVDKHTHTISLELEPAEGHGAFDMSVFWEERAISASKGVVTLRRTHSDAQPIVEHFSVGIEGGRIFLDDIKSGDYICEVSLYDSQNTSKGTAQFEATVYPGTVLHLTVPDITIHLYEVTSDFLMIDTTKRVTGSLAGTPYVIYEDIPIELAYMIDDPDFTDYEDLTLEWYLNGNILRKATGRTEEVITPDAGIHRLDVIAYTSRAGSISRASLSFEALDYELTEDLMLIQVIEDGVDGAVLRNLSDITVTPRGEVITASKTENLLQVYAPRGDGMLELQYTIEDHYGSTLDGVSAVASSPDGSFICSVSEGGNSVSICSYCYHSGTYQPAGAYTSSPGSSALSFGTLSEVVISPIRPDIYAGDRGNDAIYHFLWNGSQLVLEGVQETSLSPGLSSPRKMAIHPEGTVLASTNRDNSSLHLFSISSDGSLTPSQSFSYSTDGTMGISQVNNAFFHHDGTLFTTSNNFLCRFDSTHNGFTYGYRVKQGDFTSCRMAGLRSVVTDPWRESLYVGNVTSRGITAFSINQDGSVEYRSFTPCAPIHQLHVDPSGHYLYAISTSQHALFVFDIR